MYNLQHTIKKTLFIFFLNLIGITTAFSQGFSIELQGWTETWEKVIEDKDGRIVSAGYFKPTRTSNYFELTIFIHSAQGQLLNSARVNIPGARGIHALIENDSNYVIFFGELSNSIITVSKRKSIHFTKDLTQYQIRTWGDTTRNGRIYLVLRH